MTDFTDGDSLSMHARSTHPQPFKLHHLTYHLFNATALVSGRVELTLLIFRDRSKVSVANQSDGFSHRSQRRSQVMCRFGDHADGGVIG
jgi:hypothetical protein